MKTVFASIPVVINVPDDMEWSAREVLKGEYEAGYDGSGLTILDIGANVGAFTLWANLRWPNSRIHAWEPHPGTYQLLLKNVSSLPNVTCHNAGVLPGRKGAAPFYSTYAGDGESGFVSHLGTTIAEMHQEHIFAAQVCDPREMPSCDILKIDVEGAEADILENMAVEQVSLIVLEYQNDENRRRIKQALAKDFVVVHEDQMPWSKLLDRPQYRRELRRDHWGHLFFANRMRNRLTRRADWARVIESPLDPASFPTRKLLQALPSAILRDARRRLNV